MKKNKGTKRALLGSVIVMLLCLAMLIGSTFAWFTDSAATAVNTIQAGNLDIDIQDEAGNSLVGQPMKFQKAAGAEGEEILWEPGCTYNLKPFKIVNNGSLALKYKISISGITGSDKLNEAIEWTMTDGTNSLQLDTELHLLAGDSTELYTISGHMKETAGNEYQNESITGIAITVIATQDTVESDSFGTDYDGKALYPEANQSEFKNKMNKAGTVILGGDFTYQQPNGEMQKMQKTTTVDLGGHMLKYEGTDPDGTKPAAILVTGGTANATINGEGTIDASARGYCFDVKGPTGIGTAKLTINGGTYYGNPTVVQAEAKSEVRINGGFFQCTGENSDFLLNCIDAAYKKGTAKIIVTGGTFVNFNPADNAAEGAGTNFVKEGYKVVSEDKGNGEIWYTVVPES